MVEKPRIVVIDDDRNLLKATARLLAGADYAVGTASTAQDGWRLAQEQCPDIILLDVMLPDMNGVDLCRRIKADAALAQCAVMMCSGVKTESDDQAYGLESGADEYVTRPMSNRELLARVRGLLRLKRSEARFRSIIEHHADGIVMVNREGVIRFVNPMAEKLFGRNAEQLRGTPFGYPLVAGEPVELDILHHQGKSRIVEMRVVETEWEYEPAYIASLRDITDRKQAEEAVWKAMREAKQRQAEVSALLEGAQAVLTYRDFEPTARTIFTACTALIGATAGYVALLSEDGAENEVLFLESGGLPCTVDPELPMPIRGLRAESYRTGQAVYENDFAQSAWMRYMPEGHVQLENVLFAPLVIDGKPVGLLGMANKPGGFTDHDANIAAAFGELASIALRNSRTLESLEISEAQLKTALTAKEFLIKEVYHRTKNNMASIVDLLQLQSMRIDDEHLVHIFQDIESRVQAMLLVQQQLYQSSDLSSIHLHNYLEQLAYTIFRNLRVSIGKIDLTLNLEPVTVSPDTAIPCGLMLNELLTNALKYAFPGERTGEIRVMLRMAGSEVVELQVCDTGVGLPADFDIRTTDSLGMRLLTMFAEHQLGGSLAIQCDAGTTFVVRFPHR